MDHNHHDHHHMSSDSHNHVSHLSSVALNSTIANVSSLFVEGVQGAAEIVSDIAKNLTETKIMDHSGHLNHAHAMAGMDMTSTTMNMGGGGMGGMSHMKMYFHFGYDETILFYGWAISTVGGLIGSMLGIFCIAVIYEALKYYREYLFKKSIHSMQNYSAACNKLPDGAPIPNSTPLQYMDQVYLPSTMKLLSSGHVIQTLLHMLQFVISYSLMLIFMTYNVWLCLACTLGAGTGYFLFGWKKSVVVDVTEHCH